MEDQELKLRLSALLLVEGDQHEIVHYERKLAELFGLHYSTKQIANALKEIELIKEEIRINTFLLEAQDDMPVYPDQFYEGN